MVCQLFVALSETLHKQVSIVSTEKSDLIKEAQRMINAIKQMEASLDDHKSECEHGHEGDDLSIVYPLNGCLQILKDKHVQTSRLYMERFEQVKSQ